MPNLSRPVDLSRASRRDHDLHTMALPESGPKSHNPDASLTRTIICHSNPIFALGSLISLTNTVDANPILVLKLFAGTIPIGATIRLPKELPILQLRLHVEAWISCYFQHHFPFLCCLSDIISFVIPLVRTCLMSDRLRTSIKRSIAKT